MIEDSHGSDPATERSHLSVVADLLKMHHHFEITRADGSVEQHIVEVDGASLGTFVVAALEKGDRVRSKGWKFK